MVPQAAPAGKVRRAGPEEATNALRDAASKGGWADRFVHDGAAMMFSTRDDLPAETILIAGKHQLKVGHPK